jgi:cobalt-zinc-cadmium efflux system protein
MPLNHTHGDHDCAHDEHNHSHAHNHEAEPHNHRRRRNHGHRHVHAPARHDTAFAIGITLNSALVTAQIAIGLNAGSVALLADAVHNLGDVLGLLLAWAATVLVRRPPTTNRTYGWGRATILASLANAVLLLVSIGAIGLEAAQRLLHPAPIAASMVAAVAAAGLVVNGATAVLFMHGRDRDLNLRSTFTHMAADAALSAGVLIAAFIIMRTGANWLDPVASLGIVAVIAASTWNLLRESADLATDAVPVGLNHADIAGYLGKLPGVAEVHDLHVWALSTTENAVTVHLVQTGPERGATLVRLATTGLQQRFGIGHATIQVESSDCAALCTLRSDEVV